MKPSIIINIQRNWYQLNDEVFFQFYRLSFQQVIGNAMMVMFSQLVGGKVCLSRVSFRLLFVGRNWQSSFLFVVQLDPFCGMP